jgi:hypothetical protein
VPHCSQALHSDDEWEDGKQLREMAGLIQPLSNVDLSGALQQVCMPAAAPPAPECTACFHRLLLYVVCCPHLQRSPLLPMASIIATALSPEQRQRSSCSSSTAIILSQGLALNHCATSATHIWHRPVCRSIGLALCAAA